MIVTETYGSGSKTCGYILSFIFFGVLLWFLFGNFRTGCRSVYGEVNSCKGGDIDSSRASMETSPLRAYYPPEVGTPLDKLSATPNVAFPSALEQPAPYDQTSFSNSDEANAYYATFNPMSLQRAMPSNWRSEKKGCPATEDNKYDEFSRYTISPQKTKASTALAGVMRLGTSTRNASSRIVGAGSILHDSVVPIGPRPIGDSAFTFLDSSIRQSYIAAAMGAFPEQKNC